MQVKKLSWQIAVSGRVFFEVKWKVKVQNIEKQHLRWLMRK